MATMWMRKMMMSARDIFELPSSASMAAPVAEALTRCLRLKVTALRRRKIPLEAGRRLTGSVLDFMMIVC
jgi:hypothetical protein